MKPWNPCPTVDRSLSIAQGLVGYWPLTEGGGRRWRNAVNGQIPTMTTYPGRWIATPAGLAADVTEADSTGQLIRLENLLSGYDRATIGVMMVVQAKSSVSSTGAVVIGVSSGAYCSGIVSSDGNIDNHARFDFIANTAYARPNIGQLTLGRIYTIFATWISGTNPSVYAAVWPEGKITELTYNSRGAASGTIGASTNVVTCLDGASRAANRRHWLGLWNRPIRIDEMQSLHNFPWQMLQRQNKTALGVVTAGGWASRIRHSGQSGARVV
jgi:hypothetical protein